MKKEEIIKRLVAFRYALIGPQHHKDRDCHYKIGRKFSYSGQCVFFVEHWGYLSKIEDEDEFPTLGEAEAALIKHLCNWIAEELDIVDAEDVWFEMYPDLNRAWFEKRSKEWNQLQEELGL